MSRDFREGMDATRFSERTPQWKGEARLDLDLLVLDHALHGGAL
jgi:hypothetical protein